jgi:hypothetical protein
LGQDDHLAGALCESLKHTPKNPTAGKRDDEWMGSVRVVLAVGVLAAVIGGCGSGRATTTAADAQVETGSCQSSGVDGRTTSQSCSFVLSDGQQFRCHKAFEGSTPTARMLEHTKGCVRLPSLKLSPAVRRMTAALDKARSCLTAKGLRALGAPVLPPNPPGSSIPDGELIVGRSAAHAAFIAYYTDAARARQFEGAVARNAQRVHGRVQRRGAVTIIWTHPPTSKLQSTVEACVFR